MGDEFIMSSFANLKSCQHCYEENRRYRLGESGETRACLTLMKQMFSDSVENAEEAILCIRSLYENHIMKFIVSRWEMALLDVSAETVRDHAFRRFYIGILRKGVHQFPSLGALIVYWKKCALSEIKDMLRRQKRDQQRYISLEDVPLMNDISQMEFDLHCWKRIRTLLPQHTDYILAYAVIQLELKPAEVLVEFPYWEDQKALQRNWKHVFSKLVNDQELRDCVGVRR